MRERERESCGLLHLRLDLQLTEVRPELRLVRLQQLLEQQAQTDDALRMRIDGGQAMAISYVECTEGEVEAHWRVVQIAEGGGKHADAMEGHNPRRRSLIRFALHRKRLVVDAVGNVRVA